MDDYTLKKISMFDYPNCDYLTHKEMYYDDFDRYMNEGCSVRQAVNGLYYHGIDHLMNENGMNKFCAMIIGMLYMIEHEEVEKAQAYGTNLDIQDFETGNYDDLFTEEDLKLIKADVKLIKEYLSEHPELLEE